MKAINIQFVTLAHKILFVIINCTFVLLWARELYEESIDREICQWDGVVGVLESEKRRIDGVLEGECMVQVLKETLSAVERTTEDDNHEEIAVDGYFELLIP